jgi:hypothetical protein
VEKTLVLNSEGKGPFGVLGANGRLESILILNRIENLGKNDLSLHVMGFHVYGNELSGSLGCGHFLSFLSNFGHFEMNSCFL